MRWLSKLVVLSVCVLAGVSPAQNSEARKYINGAIALYENLEYEKALKQLQKAKAKAASSDDELNVALLQGAVLADMGKEDAALKSFKEGFSLDLKAKLPVEVSPKIAALAEKARASVAKLLAPQLEKERAEEEKKAAEAAAMAAKEAEAKRLAEQKRADEEAARNRPVPPPIVEKPVQPSNGVSVRTLSLIPAGVALASAGVATFFLVSANDKHSALLNGTAPVDQAAAYRDAGKSQATLGYVFTGIAGASLIGAAVMFALGAPKEAPVVSALPTNNGGMVVLTFPTFDLMEAR